MAYLDDVILLGERRQLVEALVRFEELVGEIGLEVNRFKTKLLVGNEEEDVYVPEGLSVVSEGLVVLGSPVGLAEWEDKECLRKVHGIKNLHCLRSEPALAKQVRFLLLSCSVSRTFNHILRTVPPSSRVQATEAFDTSLCEILAALLDIESFGDGEVLAATHQMWLPLRCGGMGVAKAEIASYWAARSISPVELPVECMAEPIRKARAKGVDIRLGWLSKPVQGGGNRLQGQLTD